MHVLTRSAAAQRARAGARRRVGRARRRRPPEPLDAAILFAPAGELVPVALRALDQGGTLAVAGIHLSDVPALTTPRELFRERQLRSVTANTRADGEEFLRLAAALAVRPTVTPRPLGEADRRPGRPGRGPGHRRRQDGFRPDRLR